MPLGSKKLAGTHGRLEASRRMMRIFGAVWWARNRELLCTLPFRHSLMCARIAVSSLSLLVVESKELYCGSMWSTPPEQVEQSSGTAPGDCLPAYLPACLPACLLVCLSAHVLDTCTCRFASWQLSWWHWQSGPVVLS